MIGGAWSSWAGLSLEELFGTVSLLMGIQNGITVGTGCRAVRCLSEETSVGGGHGAAVGELEMEGAVVAWMTVQGPSNMKKWLLAPVSAIV